MLFTHALFCLSNFADLGSASNCFEKYEVTFGSFESSFCIILSCELRVCVAKLFCLCFWFFFFCHLLFYSLNGGLRCWCVWSMRTDNSERYWIWLKGLWLYQFWDLYSFIFLEWIDRLETLLSWRHLKVRRCCCCACFLFKWKRFEILLCYVSSQPPDGPVGKAFGSLLPLTGYCGLVVPNLKS